MIPCSRRFSDLPTRIRQLEAVRIQASPRTTPQREAARPTHSCSRSTRHQAPHAITGQPTLGSVSSESSPTDRLRLSGYPRRDGPSRSTRRRRSAPASVTMQRRCGWKVRLRPQACTTAVPPISAPVEAPGTAPVCGFPDGSHARKTCARSVGRARRSCALPAPVAGAPLPEALFHRQHRHRLAPVGHHPVARAGLKAGVGVERHRVERHGAVQAREPPSARPLLRPGQQPPPVAAALTVAVDEQRAQPSFHRVQLGTAPPSGRPPPPSPCRTGNITSRNRLCA